MAWCLSIRLNSAQLSYDKLLHTFTNDQGIDRRVRVEGFQKK